MDQLSKLQAFKKRDKFSKKAWNERGLNQSGDNVNRYLTELFNVSTDKLIEAVENKSTEKQLKNVLKSNISLFAKSDYDTEEKEYICDLLIELSKVVGVDIKDHLNKWLYGSMLSTQLKTGNALKKESVIESISQPCVKWHAELETYILKKESDIPETSWIVVKCNNCEELNLLSLGPEIKETKNGNYKWVRTLFKADYDTYEKALIRLEQMKVLKK